MAFIGDMLGLFESCNQYNHYVILGELSTSGGIIKKNIVPLQGMNFSLQDLLLLTTQVNSYWKVFQILSPEMTTSWQVCVRLWSSLLDHSAVKMMTDQQTRL